GGAPVTPTVRGASGSVGQGGGGEGEEGLGAGGDGRHQAHGRGQQLLAEEAGGDDLGPQPPGLVVAGRAGGQAGGGGQGGAGHQPAGGHNREQPEVGRGPGQHGVGALGHGRRRKPHRRFGQGVERFLQLGPHAGQVGP